MNIVPPPCREYVEGVHTSLEKSATFDDYANHLAEVKKRLDESSSKEGHSHVAFFLDGFHKSLTYRLRVEALEESKRGVTTDRFKSLEAHLETHSTIVDGHADFIEIFKANQFRCTA